MIFDLMYTINSFLGHGGCDSVIHERGCIDEYEKKALHYRLSRVILGK